MLKQIFSNNPQLISNTPPNPHPWYTYDQGIHNETQFIISISHGDPGAMVPMGNQYLDCSHGDPWEILYSVQFRSPLWFGSNGETCVKLHKGNLTMIFEGKVW